MRLPWGTPYSNARVDVGGDILYTMVIALITLACHKSPCLLCKNKKRKLGPVKCKSGLNSMKTCFNSYKFGY